MATAKPPNEQALTAAVAVLLKPLPIIKQRGPLGMRQYKIVRDLDGVIIERVWIDADKAS